MSTLYAWPRVLERNIISLRRGLHLYGENGSLQAWTHGASYVLRRLLGRVLPQTVFLAPTYRCQCNCAPCCAEVRGFALLHEHGIKSRLMTYACRANLPEGLERILELARRLEVASVHINFPYASGRWAESFEELFSEADMERLRRLQGFRSSPLVLIEFPTPKNRCLAAKKSILYINVPGEVTPCPIIPYAIGNIREEPLADIWNRTIIFWGRKRKN